MIPGLQLAPNVALISVGAASAIMGRSPESIFEMAEQGRWLRWSFDISAGTKRRTRCLRIWRGSLLAWCRQVEDLAELGDVINQVLHVERPRLRASELTEGWQISRAHVHELIARGHLEGTVSDHTRWVTRASAHRFLENRVLGASPANAPGRVGAPVRHVDPRTAARRHGDPCMRLNGASPYSSPESEKPVSAPISQLPTSNS